MSIQIAQKGGTQITAPQDNSAVFTNLEYRDPDRNVFNLSKQTHGSMQFGKVYPVYSRVTMAGDSFKVKCSHFVRFASVLSPILNKINLTYVGFYVPFRLVWKYWPTWISGGYNNDGVYTDERGNYLNDQDLPTTTPFKPALPTIDVFTGADSFDPLFDLQDGSLADWLGYPTFLKGSDNFNAMDYYRQELTYLHKINLLPFMCYQKCITDWLINPNIKDSTTMGCNVPTNVYGDISDMFKSDWPDGNPLDLAYINYGLDYFTSCLPYLQRGPSYTINGAEDKITFDGTKGSTRFTYDGKSQSNLPLANLYISNNDDKIRERFPQLISNITDTINPPVLSTTAQTNSSIKSIYVDNTANLAFRGATTIQELRYLNALQEFSEKSLRIGTRYIDFLKCYFGVKSSNQSLQRSEYLGASVCPVSKMDIDQTSATSTDSTPQGTVTSKLIANGSSSEFSCYCEEHGMFFIFAFVTPETIYKNRFKTEYLYETKEEFLFPEFTHLSPQAVKLAELFYPRSVDEWKVNVKDSDTFGYQDRYNELRTDLSDVHGDFKGNLSFFLQMRNFTSIPALNSDFLKANDIDKSIFATDKVKDSAGNEYQVDQIWASFDFDVKAVRTLPKIATPSLV